MIVEFTGPFSWLESDKACSILTAPEGKNAGIYLWTVETGGGEWIYYVGQTGRSFSQRMREHFAEHMSGGYHLNEPDEFAKGHRQLLWPGRFGAAGNRSVSDFLGQFVSLAPTIAKLAEIYRFFIAPLTCEQRVRERIEAALAKYLYDQPGVVGDFQERGIWYRHRRQDEMPLEIEMRCAANLIGLPRTLEV